MTDSLKFGPEWLRNLSQPSDGGIGSASGGGGQSNAMSAPVRYMLAEHRYGREEMLALYSSKSRAPEALQNVPMLLADKWQPPLALVQMTEEETRMWQKGINSDAVLRALGQLRPLQSTRERGRGGAPVATTSMDRGRGRGRGSYYPRGLSYEEESSRDLGGIPINTYASRGRYERSQSGQERVWSDRNGSENTEWNGSTSPRKDFLGRSAMDNWRSRGATEEEGGGWKTSGHPNKWNRNSWRESGGDREPDMAEQEGGRTLRPLWENRENRTEIKGKTTREWSDENRSGLPRKPADEGDHLPEWAMANPSEIGGSFDATGAFHGGTFSDDEDGTNDRARKNRISQPPPKQEVEDTEEVEPAPLKYTVPDHLMPIMHRYTEDGVTTSLCIQPDDPLYPGFMTRYGKFKEAQAAAKAEALKKQKRVAENKKATNNSPDSPISPEVVKESVEKKSSRKQEDDMDLMMNADALVAKLTDEEEQPRAQVNLMNPQEKWYYRDPQGDVQGPFGSKQMWEWFTSGYFNTALEIRRERDPSFSLLGELINIWGAVPFGDPQYVLRMKDLDIKTLLSAQLPAVPVPIPMPGQPVVASAAPVATTMAPMPDHNQFPFHMFRQQQQQQQKQQPQNQQPQNQQQQQQPPPQQLQTPSLPLPLPQPQPLPPLHPASIQNDPDWNKLTMLEKQAVKYQISVAKKASNEAVTAFINHIYQQKQEQQQVESVWGAVAVNQSPQQSGPQANVFCGNVEAWAAQRGPPPPGKLPASLWDIQPKDMKTEQQVLEEQMKAEQERQMKDFRNASMAERQRKEQERAAAQAEAARLKLEADVRRKAEEKARLEEEMRRLREEEEARRAEVERQRLEEQRKLEQLRQEEERQRALVEELARQQEELRKQQAQEEEDRRLRKIQAELQRKAKEQEDRRREKEEAKKRHEELLKQQVKEKMMQAAMVEEKKLQELRQIKEQQQKQLQMQQQIQQHQMMQKQLLAQQQQQQQQQQKAKAAPSAPWTHSATQRSSSTSLAEIQKLQEKEKRELQYLREQMMAAAELIAKEDKEAREIMATAAFKQQQQQLQLKWADRSQGPQTPIKSLAEIQAEEQRQLAKQARAKAETSPPSAPAASAGIWNSASQSLTWSQGRSVNPAPPGANVWAAAAAVANMTATQTSNSSATSNTPSIWGAPADNNAAGLWEEIPMPPSKTPTKSSNATKAKSSEATSNSGSSANASSNAKSKSSKSRAKKEEQQVMKLFEQNSQFTDEFTSWCVQSLSGFRSSGVDIPTFVVFLKDVESPYEVNDYVRSYLGDGREARDFARSFLERRSKWRNAQKAAPAEDDMCKPAPAINPTSNDFQEVKGKGKKTKKSKMFRVDNDILGFSVTAAQDRINVGDRDYGEGM